MMTQEQIQKAKARIAAMRNPENLRPQLLREGYSKMEVEEIIARIECGMSVDAAIQTVTC